MDALAKKIYDTIQPEGLVWNKDHKKVPVAFGMFKLQMGCVVEDEKVSTDDIFEKIEVWEDEVQSIDIVTFQKVWGENIKFLNKKIFFLFYKKFYFFFIFILLL